MNTDGEKEVLSPRRQGTKEKAEGFLCELGALRRSRARGWVF
jgi:hypothetical protein